MEEAYGLRPCCEWALLVHEISLLTEAVRDTTQRMAETRAERQGVTA